MKTLKILIVLFMIYISGYSQTGCIKGYIYDKIEKKPVIGTNIIFFESNISTICDKNGFFKVCDLKPGNYTIGLSLVGYKDTTINDLTVKVDSDIKLTIYLSECEYHILGHTRLCPVCGKDDEVVPILYGVATRKMIKKEKKGQVYLGGDRTGCDPVYYCKRDKCKF